VAGGVGPSSPFVASGEGPSLPFVSGGVGPRSPLVRGGVGPSSPFVPGGVGPSSSFGLGPSFTVRGAGGSSSCMDGGWCCWGLVVFRGWRCWGLVVLFVGGGGVPSSCRFWVVVVVVRPHGFSCAVWSCRRSRVRVVGGRSCLRAFHPSSSSLASSCIVSVCCRRVSSSSLCVLTMSLSRALLVVVPCCCHCRALVVTCRLVARRGTCVRNIGRGR